MERQIGEVEGVESHRRRPPLVREALALLLGDKGFPEKYHRLSMSSKRHEIMPNLLYLGDISEDGFDEKET